MTQETPASMTAGRLKAADAARYAGITTRTWYKWLETGQLDSITHTTPGGSRYWFQDEVDAWLRSRCFAPAPTGEATA